MKTRFASKLATLKTSHVYQSFRPAENPKNPLENFPELFCARFLPVLEVILYFFSLIFFARMCFMAVYRFIMLVNIRGQREVPPAKGGEDEHPRLVAAWKNDNAECCIDINGVEAGCLQMEDLKSEMAEDGWAEMYGSLEGKLETREENSGGGEDGWSFQIDSLAEELWNRYFGRCSSWQYKGVDVQGWLGHVKVMIWRVTPPLWLDKAKFGGQKLGAVIVMDVPFKHH